MENTPPYFTNYQEILANSVAKIRTKMLADGARQGSAQTGAPTVLDITEIFCHSHVLILIPLLRSAPIHSALLHSAPLHRQSPPRCSTLEVGFEKLPDATHFLMENENGLANQLRAPPFPPASIHPLLGVAANAPLVASADASAG